MRILEIKFERNWNFANYLRVWDFKKLNHENQDFGSMISLVFIDLLVNCHICFTLFSRDPFLGA